MCAVQNARDSKNIFNDLLIFNKASDLPLNSCNQLGILYQLLEYMTICMKTRNCGDIHR